MLPHYHSIKLLLNGYIFQLSRKRKAVCTTYMWTQHTLNFTSPPLLLLCTVLSLASHSSSTSMLKKCQKHADLVPCRTRSIPQLCVEFFSYEISRLGESIQSAWLLLTFRETSPRLLPLTLKISSFPLPDLYFQLQAQQEYFEESTVQKSTVNFQDMTSLDPEGLPSQRLAAGTTAGQHPHVLWVSKGNSKPALLSVHLLLSAYTPVKRKLVDLWRGPVFLFLQ